jgi:hypothetical protein
MPSCYNGHMAECGQGVSDAVKQMALELEREYDIQPLGEAEERPDGYYTVGHYTGRSVLG